MLALSCDTSNKVVEDLVSAFVQALHAVKSSECTPPNSYGEDVRQLVSEFDGLPGAERDRVAGAITLLWDAFYERFDGLSGFLAAEYHDRHAYLKELEVAQERMARNRKGAAAHYYHATAMMLSYVKAIIQQQSLEARVSEAVQRGRVLLRERLPADRATKPQMAPAKTEVDALMLTSVGEAIRAGVSALA